MRGKSLKNILFLLALIALQACSATSGISGATSSDTTGTEATSNTTNVDSFIGMPVTVAKLEGLDSSQIVISVEPVGSSSQLRYTTDGVEIIADCTLIYSVNGLPGSVKNVSSTPYVMAYNANLEVSSIVAANANGSFYTQICGRYQDKIVLSALSSDQTESSEPLVVTAEDEDGQTTFIITDTNSESIQSGFNVLTDQSGNAYYVITNVDGTSDFYRRNSDGSLIEQIWAGNSDIPQVLGAMGDDYIFYFNQDGVLKQAILPSTLSTSFLLKPDAMYSTLQVEAIAGYDIGVAPSDAGEYSINVIQGTDPDGNIVDMSGYVHVKFPADGNLTDISGATFAMAGPEGIQEALVQHSSSNATSFMADLENNTLGFVVATIPTIDGCATTSCLYRRRGNNLDEAFAPLDIIDTELFNLPAGIIQIDVHPVDWNAAILLTADAVYSFHNFDTITNTSAHFGVDTVGDALAFNGAPSHTCNNGVEETRDLNEDCVIDINDADDNSDGVDDRMNTALKTLDTSGTIKRIAWSKKGRHLLGCKLYSDGKYSLVSYDVTSETFIDVVPEELRTSSGENFCVPTADITTTVNHDIHIWWPKQHSIIYYAQNSTLQSTYMNTYNTYLVDNFEQAFEVTDAGSINAIFGTCDDFSQGDDFSEWDSFCACFGPLRGTTTSQCQTTWKTNCENNGLDTTLAPCVLSVTNNTFQ